MQQPQGGSDSPTGRFPFSFQKEEVMKILSILAMSIVVSGNFGLLVYLLPVAWALRIKSKYEQQPCGPLFKWAEEQKKKPVRKGRFHALILWFISPFFIGRQAKV
ncbi:MAG: hypothetical protein R8K47_03340 [Mariprofundaceae bacterium]